MTSESDTECSNDETPKNASSKTKLDDTTDVSNDERSSKSKSDAEVTDQLESVQTSSGHGSKRKIHEEKKKKDEIPSKIPRTEVSTDVEERVSVEKSMEENASKSKSETDEITIESEPDQSTSKYDEADVPSDLCSASSDRSIKNENFKTPSYTAVVANHYNSIEEKGLSFRNQSRIFYLRNFNNWIKAMLIYEYLRKVRHNANYGTPIRVMDMCCGKGGDLYKWRKTNVSHLIFVDIADVSVRQCENRYRDIQGQRNNPHGYMSLFSAEFITADCTNIRLRKEFKDPSIQLDLVSCQFALHYSFESLEKATCMLRNASESLKPGGYFIATIPDANDLVYRWRKAKSNKFGNDIYNIEFCCDQDNIPLFGAKYNFYLEGVVNCPEFLVYLPLLKKLALKAGLDFVSFERFEEFYERHQHEGKSTLGKMQALETYPPYHGVSLVSQNIEDYQDATNYMQNTAGHRKIGTLSLPEWEAITLYSVVVFKKMKVSWDAEGKPKYSKP